ncbi:uncharacterized protein SPAPADRAFT_143611 [Spathaspora passalidarum NRRL Y-27907]|uniref:DNA polymerase V n=1 Tax=Spathaspora passalidarum (strain NRRL Y-27907 / 11-Y1) TaxID=619300 RepID=G3AUL5_SPAPN|nr:uncharacterized protein SPAPADRAFT_143611 [Spathaspora passalidarum NRRL Y-27907]EGW30571.1 hypothetical protein SPAPADRAFT_143611 [Spathaspora passalidarum NRRL Y-27907]
MPVSKDHYYKLASELPKERISAATSLISELTSEDSQSEWDYALNRLVKGLITTRQSARFGFSMALTEVVTELIKRNVLTVKDYLKLVLDTTEVRSNMKGKDERGVLFGRLFGLQVLINSGLLLKEQTDTVFDFIDALVHLAGVKSWLRETTIFTLCQFIKTVEGEDHKNEILLRILQSINNAGLNLSTEGIAVYLSIEPELREQLTQQLVNVKANWKFGDPLKKGNLPLLAKVLKDVEVVEDEDTKKQKGNWSTRIPFVWDLILANFNQINEGSDQPSKKKKKSKKTTVESPYISAKEFFKVVVDESLFSDKSSHERKYWGFEIFQKFFTLLADTSSIEYLFTPNLMRCLINQSSQSNRFLNKISVNTLQLIVKHCQQKPELTPIVLKCLLDETKGGCWNFDLVTKSHTIDELFANASKSDIAEYINILLEKFESALSTQEGTNSKKSHDNILKWCLDKIVNLIRKNKQPIEEVFKMLIKYSFFESEVSDNIRDICQERLRSILGEVISVKRDDGRSWSTFCLQLIQKLEKSEKCIVELDEELTSVKSDTMTILNDILELEAKAPSQQLYCFELLFSMVLMELYMMDEETIQVINELKLCYESQFDKSEDIDSGMVLTEVILSFISRKSSLLKKLSNLVWEHFLCGKDEEGKSRLTLESLKLLFDVLVARENKEGEQKLFEGEGEYEEENGDEDEEEDEEEESEDSESDSDDKDDDMSEVDKQTNLKLAEALGIPTGESGEVKFDELDSSEDEEYESDSMDDEQMMAMDDQLSKIFKDRHDQLSNLQSGNKRKLEVLEAKERMIFFKHRVLDLLEIFVKVQPNSHFNLYFIEPLIKLINLTLDKNLGLKAHKLLKTRISKTKITREEVELYAEPKAYLDSLVELVKTLQSQANATKISNQSVVSSYSQGSITISKNIINLDPTLLESIVDIYSDSLKSWTLSSDSKLQPSLFFDFINWINSKKSSI